MKASEWASSRIKEAFELLAAYHRACAQTATVSFGGSLGERPQSGGAQFVERTNGESF